jgi:APA family basic amino acid/polyamine antiporter
VTGHWEKVRAGGAGTRVVQEARQINARAIVMPLPPRRAGSASVFGHTLETVLEERPCRVIVTTPAHGTQSASREASPAGPG